MSAPSTFCKVGSACRWADDGGSEYIHRITLKFMYTRARTRKHTRIRRIQCQHTVTVWVMSVESHVSSVGNPCMKNHPRLMMRTN